MKRILLLLILLCLNKALHAQYVYTIKADSVKITNSCDTAELIIENHTQNVSGFLFNKGRGRTEFRKPLLKVGDSVYAIGGDTIKLANAWVQGGNRFGTAGILGTKDYNHVDLHTNDAVRARMTNTGNFLIGKTDDNGCRLQVEGCGTFSENVNIGNATITNAGKLINTNAILFNHFISQYRSYMEIDPFISKLDNILYNYNARFNVVNSVGDDGCKIIKITVPEDEFEWENSGIVYPQGDMYFSFWNNGIPSAITVKMWNVPGGAPAAIFSTNINRTTNGSGFFHIPIAGTFNYLKQLEITITPASPGAFINLQNIEYCLSVGGQGLNNPYPTVSKYGPEYLYNFLFFKQNGQRNICISPYVEYPTYFLNNTLIGKNTDNGNKLQVAGNTSMAGNLSVTGNAITFSGLSANNSTSRILVADANGNLYYRDASSLGLSETTSSALAVERKSVDADNSQAAQTKKMEELTWLIIQQEKELKSLKQEVEALKALIKRK